MQKMGGQTSTWPTIVMHDCTQSWRIFTHPLVATGKFQPGVMLQFVQSVADTTLSKQWDILNIDASYQWTTMPEGDFSFNLQHLVLVQGILRTSHLTLILKKKTNCDFLFHIFTILWTVGQAAVIVTLKNIQLPSTKGSHPAFSYILHPHHLGQLLGE